MCALSLHFLPGADLDFHLYQKWLEHVLILAADLAYKTDYAVMPAQQHDALDMIANLSRRHEKPMFCK